MARTLNPIVWLKRALMLIVIGLIVQLVCLLHITPASFLVFAGFGVGPVAVGLVVFGYAAVRARQASDGSAKDADHAA